MQKLSEIIDRHHMKLALISHLLCCVEIYHYYVTRNLLCELFLYYFCG
jgi:hypothetical protein